MATITTGPALIHDDLTIPIWRQVNLVGREDPMTRATPDCDLTPIDDRRGVSRKHARLDYRDGTIFVRDLGSTNGTYVNGDRLAVRAEVKLVPGDVIRFGRVEMVFEDDAGWPDGVVPEWDSSTIELQGPDAPSHEGDGWVVDEENRMLATVMFTDIAGSTGRAVSIGDHAWAELLETHHNVVRWELRRFDGREVRSTGDGFMATFASPARAVRCGWAIIKEVRRLGMDVRVGLHTGEVEINGGEIEGIAVHIAARVAAKAGPAELLVSATVRDLVTGSGLRFADRGSRTLKGMPGKWRLYGVVADTEAAAAP
ncbi:MAG: hypothetical protein QOE92_2412 [Chloroflexota bacterium]|jgi:class 3 adenylate cyclase|nr:hypothetical protein [Chloroflexota bacterium]